MCVVDGRSVCGDCVCMSTNLQSPLQQAYAPETGRLYTVCGGHAALSLLNRR